jgi:hypothetical protein
MSDHTGTTSKAAELPVRLTPTQRLYEVTMAALTRRGGEGMTLSLKQNAAGTWLCDGLQMHQREDEGAAEFLSRASVAWVLVIELLGGALPEPDPA